MPQVIERVGLSACCTTLLALAGSMYKAIAQPCDNARFTQIHDLFAGKQAAVVLVLIVMRTATSGWMFLAAQSFIHIFSMKKKSPVLRLVWRFIVPVDLDVVRQVASHWLVLTSSLSKTPTCAPRHFGGFYDFSGAGGDPETHVCGW